MPVRAPMRIEVDAAARHALQGAVVGGTLDESLVMRALGAEEDPRPQARPDAVRGGSERMTVGRSIRQPLRALERRREDGADARAGAPG